MCHVTRALSWQAVRVAGLSHLPSAFPSLSKGMPALEPDKFVMVSSKIALGCPTWELAGLVHGKILTPISVCME